MSHDENITNTADLPDPDAVALGRRYIQIAAAVIIAINLVVIAAYVVKLGTGKLGSQAVRTLATVGMMSALVRGKGWARWTTLLVLLLGMTAVVPVFGEAGAFRMPKLPGTLGMLAMFVSYGVIGRGLLYSQSVRAFFRATKLAAQVRVPQAGTSDP